MSIHRESRAMLPAGLLAVCAALAACAGGTETQVVTGQISAARPIAVRAIDGQDVGTEGFDEAART